MRTHTGCCATLAWLASLASIAGAQVPTLAHTAPWLGSTLELTLSGAPAFAHVALLVSPRPGDIDTPWGRLELERAQIQVADLGTADFMGLCTFHVPLPSDASLAEMPLHYQALVRPHVGTPELSEAVHLRILGTRAYVSCSGSTFAATGPVTGELTIVSLLHDERVASVTYGHIEYHAPFDEPAVVFDASFSRGAVMASPSELLVFDPFFGRVLQRVAFSGASATLFTSLDHARLFVLEGVIPVATTPRLQVLDFASAQIVATVPLADGFAMWAIDAVREIAYVSSSPTSFSQPFVTRVDLANAQVLGTVPVGSPTSARISAIAAAPDAVVVASDDYLFLGELSRIAESAGAPAVSVVAAQPNTSRMVTLPSLDLLALSSPLIGFPGGYLNLQRLASPTGSLALWPPHGGVTVAMEANERGLWIAADTSSGGGDYVAYYDVANEAWREGPSYSYIDDVTAIALAGEGDGERVCIAVDGALGPVISSRPRLVVHDPRHGTSTNIPTAPGLESLIVIEVP